MFRDISNMYHKLVIEPIKTKRIDAFEAGEHQQSDASYSVHTQIIFGRTVSVFSEIVDICWVACAVVAGIDGAGVQHLATRIPNEISHDTGTCLDNVS